MAEIIGGGEPVNDAERAVIRHLRDHGPAYWVVLHNVELRLRGNRKYEIDVLVVTEFAVTLIDVKGTHGTDRGGGRPVVPGRPGAVQVAGGEAERPCPGAEGKPDTARAEPDLRGLPRGAHRPGRPSCGPEHRSRRRRAARGHRPCRPDPRTQQARTGAHRLPPRHPPVPRPDHRGPHRCRPAADRTAALRALGGHRVARRDRSRSPNTARGTPTPGALRRCCSACTTPTRSSLRRYARRSGSHLPTPTTCWSGCPRTNASSARRTSSAARTRASTSWSSMTSGPARCCSISPTRSSR